MTPRTAAGRRLLGKNAGSDRDAAWVEWLANDIIAIEREAGDLATTASSEAIGTPTKPPSEASISEIAAGLRELGTGGTPAFIRGYNRGFDDAWGQATAIPEPLDEIERVVRTELALPREDRLAFVRHYDDDQYGAWVVVEGLITIIDRLRPAVPDSRETPDVRHD